MPQIKKHLKTRKFIYPSAITLLLLLVGLGLLLYVHVPIYMARGKVTDTLQIKHAILTASEGMLQDAPIDPRTGDAYLPTARLFVPADHTPLGLRYSYITAESYFPAQLTLSTSMLFSRNAHFFYATLDIDETFEQVPKLQACQRAVVITIDGEIEPEFGNRTLNRSKQVADGRTLYFYTDNDCAEDAAQLVEELQVIESY